MDIARTRQQVPAPLPVAWRYPLLATGFMALLIAVGGGLLRMGWPLPYAFSGPATWHGALLIGGFFGTVITLERAVAVAAPAAFLAPLSAAAGAVALLAGWPGPASLLMLLASAVFCQVSWRLWRRIAETYAMVMLTGAGSWLAGNLLWQSGAAFAAILPWWCLFLLLTIAGERLELTRFLGRSSGATRLFPGIVILLIVASAAYGLGGGNDLRLFSLGLVALACWLLIFDIARHAVRQTGLTRYIGTCLLCGYGWLLTGGVIGMAWHPLQPGAGYDAWLHAILLGFVMMMVFGHALVIFPALTRLRLAYHRGFYLPVLVMQGGLLVRLAGDLAGCLPARQAGGLINALAIVLFLLSVLYAVWLGRKA